MTATPHGTGTGSVAEEAARLFEALQEWSRRGAAGATEATDATDAPRGRAAEAPECRVCPLCRLLGTLREARPEVFEHLTTAAAALSAAVTDLVVTHEQEWTGRRSTGLERIDIS